MKKLSKYNTVWIDLTDFIDWQGHFTGIQRVEYELASRFKKLENVKFFYYNPIKSSFVETPFAIIEEKAKIASGEKKISQKELDRQVRLSKRVVKRMKEAIPPKTRMRLVKIKGQIQRVNEKAPFDPLHPFNTNDLILVLGGNWAFATFMPSLKKVKSKMKGVKSVHVLYDFIPVMQPGFFPDAMEKSFGKYIREVLKVSDLSLSISENTKKDAITYAGKKDIHPNTIVPFRLGDDFVKLPPEKPKEAEVTKGNYIFCVGTFEVRKNYQLLYYVLKLAKARGIQLPKIVIVGKVGWLSDSTLHMMKNDPDTKDGIVLLSKCSDKEMAWLFENCAFTMYPSFYEGWGLPVAEALRYGKMCLSSNTSSLPEVGKELVDYYSPYDTKECLDKIQKYLVVKTLKKAEEAIAKNYRATTWDDTFKQAIEVIEKVL